MTDILLIIFGLSALAFWQKSIFLFIMVGIVAFIFGMSLANDNTAGSALWVAGVGVAIYGLYCVVRVIADLMGRKKRK